MLALMSPIIKYHYLFLDCSTLEENILTDVGIIKLKKHIGWIGEKCGHPAVPANAKLALSSESLDPGTIATYTCDDGYELFGSPTSTCSASGVWQGELPFCGN
uniref:Sushi domain-containing protein n=1 Tax=Rhodnius prolixus TaxID=13249 RepID=T1HHH2_RHOPR